MKLLQLLVCFPQAGFQLPGQTHYNRTLLVTVQEIQCHGLPSPLLGLVFLWLALS